jgi:nicotinamidase/pyrazinamidase
MAKKKGMTKKIIFGFFGAIVLFIFILIINLIITNKVQSIVTKGQPIENHIDNQSALLVIDIQEATTGDLSMYPFFEKNSEELINQINLITERFDKQNIPVIYVRSELTNPLINLINNSYAKGSPGAKFDKRMKIVSDLEVRKKGEDSFRNTNLDSILTGKRVNELFIVGLDAADCVNATVKAAQNRNYKVNLIEEAIISKSAEMKDSMMVDFIKRGVNILHINTLNVSE